MSLSSTVRRPLFWIIAIPVTLVVVVVGGSFIYAHFIHKDTAELSFGDLSTASSASADPSSGSGVPVTDPSSGGGAPTAGVDGQWTVNTGKAGYRVHEVRFGSGLEAVGRTDEISGDMTIAGTSVTAVDLTVQLDSVATDESQRDGQFRGRIMDVATYPTATFKLTKPIDLSTLPADQQETTVSATGEFTIHGQTNEVTFDLSARRNGDQIEINGSIPVKWADYGIPDPSFGPNSVDDHGQIEFVVAFAPS